MWDPNGSYSNRTIRSAKIPTTANTSYDISLRGLISSDFYGDPSYNAVRIELDWSDGSSARCSFSGNSYMTWQPYNCTETSPADTNWVTVTIDVIAGWENDWLFDLLEITD